MSTIEVQFDSADANDPEVIDFKESLRKLADEVGYRIEFIEGDEAPRILYIIPQLLAANDRDASSREEVFRRDAQDAATGSRNRRRLDHYQANGFSGLATIRTAQSDLVISKADLVYVGHDGLYIQTENPLDESRIKGIVNCTSCILSTDDDRDSKLRKFLISHAPAELCPQWTAIGYASLLVGWLPLVIFISIILPHIGLVDESLEGHWTREMYRHMIGQYPRSWLQSQVAAFAGITSAFILFLCFMVFRKITLQTVHLGDGTDNPLKLTRGDGVTFKAGASGEIAVYRPLIAGALSVVIARAKSTTSKGREKQHALCLIPFSDRWGFIDRDDDPFSNKKCPKRLWIGELLALGFTVVSAVFSLIVIVLLFRT